MNQLMRAIEKLRVMDLIEERDQILLSVQCVILGLLWPSVVSRIRCYSLQERDVGYPSAV